MSDPTSTSLAIPEADRITTALERIGGQCLALIAGLPASLTYFAADLCRDLLARQHGACEVVNLNDLSAETIEHISETSAPAIFLAEVPDRAVAEMARSAGFPILVINQDFSSACYDFMSARGANLLDTARTIARAHMGLRALADIPRTIVIDTARHDEATHLAAAIACGLRISTDVCSSMADARGLAQPLAGALNEIFVYERVPASEETDTLLASLGRFYQLDEDRQLQAWAVPIDVLLEGTPPHHAANNTIDLVGPARCLTLGPYFYLPAGRWSLVFSFQSSENISTNTLMFDVTADEEVKFSETYVMISSGKFEFRAEFEVRNAFYPFEFRTFLTRGAIEGKFALLSLTLERI